MRHRARAVPSLALPLIVALVFPAFLPARGPLAGDSARAARVDALFAEWDRDDSPGASVAVVRDGEIVLARGYGSAQLEHGVPIEASTVFHVASVTKQLTAFGIVLLARDGALSLDDDIREHLPELPELGDTVRIRHLIHHTSGIRDQWELLAMAGWRLDDVITREQILRLMRRQRELNFEPGSEYLYSNMGYTLLAEIIERVGGKPFPEWMAERVFRPLGMERTHLHVDHEHLVPGRAYSYALRRACRDEGSGGPTPAAGAGASARDPGCRGVRRWRKEVLSYANAGATSLFTTAPDLARWLRNLETGRVGGAGAVRRMHARGVLTDGDTLDYAFAIARGEHRGRTTWAHGGADAGFRTYVLRIPEPSLGVVVLSNLASFDPGGMARKVADVYLDVDPGAVASGEDAPDEARDSARAAAPARPGPSRELLERYAGRYDVEEIGLMTIALTDEDRLTASTGGEAIALSPEPRSDSSFLAEGPAARIRFVREEGEVTGLVVEGVVDEVGPYHGRRLDDESPDPAALAAYEGAYYSPELETIYRIAVADSALVARHHRHGGIALEPVEDDVFSGDRWFFDRLEFVRGDAGGLEGFRVTGGRVRNLLFVRLDDGALPDVR